MESSPGTTLCSHLSCMRRQNIIIADAYALFIYLLKCGPLSLVLQDILGDGGRAAIQTQGSVSNPFGSTFVYGYRNIALEVRHLLSVYHFVIC